MPQSIQIDLKTTSISKFASVVKDHAANMGDEESLDVSVQNCEGNCYVGTGLRFSGTISLRGTLGDFCFLSFGLADGTIEGNVGHFLAHSIHSGSLTVRGHAGHAVGALGAGGLVTVYGNAADRLGVLLHGTDIVVRGSVGALAGLGMRDGNIVIGGNAGPEMGKGMKGGSIFLRGEAESLSSCIEEVRMREPDKLKIGMLMLKSGIKTTGKEFRLYRPIA